eukprot:scaffold240_cov243-Pinguiococcus_pyrenoidosus.AAC.17
MHFAAPTDWRGWRPWSTRAANRRQIPPSCFDPVAWELRTFNPPTFRQLPSGLSHLGQRPRRRNRHDCRPRRKHSLLSSGSAAGASSSAEARDCAGRASRRD